MALLGRAAASALMVHHDLQRHPLTTIAKLAQNCNMTIPTVTKSLQHLINKNIVQELTGKERHRIYTYKKYLDVLDAGISGRKS